MSSLQLEAAVANRSGAMEQETISKTGRVRKAIRVGETIKLK